MKKVLLILSLFLLGLSADKSHAQLQDMPGVASMNINDFVAQSQLITKTFEDNSLLDFQIQVPNEFTIKSDDTLKNITKRNTIYGEIFSAIGPSTGAGRPYINIESIELDRLISAKNWMVTRALEWAYTLRAIESKDDQDNSYEAFYIRLDKMGNTEVVRAKGFRHQNRLVLVEYVLPVSAWNSDRDKQLYTINSFEFLNDYSVRSPEQMLDYNFAESFYMQYPRSWVFRKLDSNAANRLDLNLKTADINGFVMADADFTMVSERSLTDRSDEMVYPLELPHLIRQRTEAIENMGYEADPLMEQRTVPVSFESTLNTTEVYPLRKKLDTIYVTEEKNPISKELWLTVIRRPEDGKSYVISMVAPSRKIRLPQWAIAIESYQEMIKSIQ